MKKLEEMFIDGFELTIDWRVKEELEDVLVYVKSWWVLVDRGEWTLTKYLWEWDVFGAEYLVSNKKLGMVSIKWVSTKWSQISFLKLSDVSQKDMQKYSWELMELFWEEKDKREHEYQLRIKRKSKSVLAERILDVVSSREGARRVGNQCILANIGMTQWDLGSLSWVSRSMFAAVNKEYWGIWNRMIWTKWVKINLDWLKKLLSEEQIEENIKRFD